jgi:MarR family transcriptional regulator, transcriptional regulator for hemolysin
LSLSVLIVGRSPGRRGAQSSGRFRWAPSADLEDFDVKGFDDDVLWYPSCVPPVQPPIGLQLARAARIVSRAFDEALAAAGGSIPVWLVLLNLKARRPTSQRELAAAVGITEATLTHHLNTMDTDGLITRRRDMTNRRIHVVELTDTGEEAFLRLRRAAQAFDKQLRDGIPDDELAGLDSALDRLVRNVGACNEATPWRGLIEAKPATR